MSYLDAFAASVTIQDAYCPFPAAPPGSLFLGSPQSRTRRINGVDLKFANVTAAVSWTPFSALNEFVVSVAVDNGSAATIPRLCVAIPLPAFTIRKTNTPAWGKLASKTWLAAAPCAEIPMQAFYLAGDVDGLGVVPVPRGPRCVLNRWPSQPMMHLWFDVAVAPGKSAAVSFTIAEGTASIPTLIAPWWRRQRGVEYLASAWPVAQANLGTPLAPGFKEPYGGRLAKAKAAIAAGLRCVQMWDQVGFVVPSYSPDMFGTDSNCTDDAAQLVTDIRSCGARAGFGCRPGSSIEAARSRVAIERATSIAPFIEQLREAVSWGVTDLYCDSFGYVNGNAGGAMLPAEPTDGDFARDIRRELTASGVGAPSIAEVSTELTWGKMGIYLACRRALVGGGEFAFGGPDGGNIDDFELDLIRLAYPGAHAQAQIAVPDAMFPAAIDYCGSRRVVPMVQWHLLAGPTAKAVTQAIKDYTAKYVDPTTGGWR